MSTADATEDCSSHRSSDGESNSCSGESSTSTWSLPTKRRKQCCCTFKSAFLPLYFIAIVGVYPVWCMGHGLELGDDSAISYLYSLVQTATTVGYGDLAPVPADRFGRWFTIIMILQSLVIFAWFLSRFVDSMLEHAKSTVEVLLQNDIRPRLHKRCMSDKQWEVVTSTFLFAGALAFGAVFFRYTEHCSCSYGYTEIQDCNPTTFETCRKSGGQVKDWLGSFYFSVVTVTTVGYGDLSCMTKVGRTVACIWIPVGVAITARWVTSMSAYFFDREQKSSLVAAGDGGVEVRLLREGLCHAEIALAHLSREQHHLLMLRRHGVVSEGMMKALDERYDTLAPPSETLAKKLGHQIDVALGTSLASHLRKPD